MMSFWRLAAVAILGVFALSACTHFTLSEQECLEANWGAIGRTDGESGYTKGRFQEHIEACEQYGVKPVKAAYVKGWTQGVRSYCTPRVGFIEGKNGETYLGVCPNDLSAAFIAEYNRGYAIYEV